MGEALAAMAAGFSVTELLSSSIDKTTEFGESVRRLELTTGLSAEQASIWAVAMRRAGVDLDNGGRGLNIFEKNLTNLRDKLDQGKTGAAPFSNTLKELGINAFDSEGKIRPMSEVLADVQNAFSRMGPGAAETAAAMNLFGRSGANLLPVLNMSATDMAEVAAQAKKMGLVLSQDNVEAIHGFVIAQREAKEGMAALQLEIGTAVLPVVARLAQGFVDIQPKIRQVMADIGGAIKDFVDGPVGQFLVSFVATRIQGVVESFNSVAAGIRDAISLVTNVIHGNWAKAWEDFKNLAGDAVKFIAGQILYTFGNLANAVVDIFEGMINGVIGRLDSIKLPEKVLGVSVPGGGGGLGIEKVELPRFESGSISSVSDIWKKLGDEVAHSGRTATDGIDPLNDALDKTGTKSKTLADELSSAFQKVMSGGSLELAQLQLQSDQLQVEIDKMTKKPPLTKEEALAGGIQGIGGNQSFTAAYLRAHPEQVEGLVSRANAQPGGGLLADKAAIDAHIKTLQDQQKVEKDRFDLANKALPTEAQRFELEQKLTELEGKATKPLGDIGETLNGLLDTAIKGGLIPAFATQTGVLEDSNIKIGGFRDRIEEATGAIGRFITTLAGKAPAPTGPWSNYPGQVEMDDGAARAMAGL